MGREGKIILKFLRKIWIARNGYLLKDKYYGEFDPGSG
jgi:hypothetical protein